jgi:hypothetical protein
MSRVTQSAGSVGVPHGTSGTPALLDRWDGMSKRAETCRKKVAECQRLAMAASDPAIRQMYLDLAQQWRELAEQTERLGAMQNRSR